MALAFAAGHIIHRALDYRAEMPLGLVHRVAVAPEVIPVDIPVIEPAGELVRVVDPLAGDKLFRVAAGDHSPVIRPQGIEDRFLELFPVAPGGERLPIDRDIDLAGRFVVDYLHVFKHRVVLGHRLAGFVFSIARVRAAGSES